MNKCTIVILAITVLVGELAGSPLHYVASDLNSARIVNGNEVDITKVPYQAALRRRVTAGWAHMCGAVIISTKSLLTAAHCTSSYISEPSALQAVVGSTYRLSGGKTYSIAEVIVHELYSSMTLENDISMVITAKKISFSTSVNSINYAGPDTELKVGTDALVSGYGITSYDGSSPLVLMAANVKIVEQDTCVVAYNRIADITRGMLCASGTDPPRDACQGDSGGPLVAKNALIGIVSWGEGCAEVTYPGVYTRVSVYSDWIESYIVY